MPIIQQHAQNVPVDMFWTMVDVLSVQQFMAVVQHVQVQQLVQHVEEYI